MCATASVATIEGLCGQVAHAAQEATPAAAVGGWLRRDQFEACRGQTVIVHTPFGIDYLVADGGGRRPECAPYRGRR